MNGWYLVVPGLLFVGLLLRFSRRQSADKFWDAHAHEDAVPSGLVSWRDCTGRAPSGTELKRAYRKLAREAHPDKKGSNERFQSLDSAQQQLKNPLQYNLRAAFVPGRGAYHDEGHGIRDARLALRRTSDGTRVHLEVDFTSPVPRGFWRFGLLAKDVSSIEYGGSQGGYDICCQFMKDSRCAYKPYSELVAQHEAHQDGMWDSAYSVHDCPLKPNMTYTGVVDKPLHVASDGLWAAVVELMDTEGQEFACAAVTFRMAGDELRTIEEQKVQL